MLQLWDLTEGLGMRQVVYRIIQLSLCIAGIICKGKVEGRLPLCTFSSLVIVNHSSVVKRYALAILPPQAIKACSNKHVVEQYPMQYWKSPSLSIALHHYEKQALALHLIISLHAQNEFIFTN